MSARIVLRSSRVFRSSSPFPCIAPWSLRSLPTVRHSSTAPPSSLINSTTIPAPHVGNIRVLSLNNPATRNALSVALLYSLAEHIVSIEKEHGLGPTRALIIASEIDSAFCAGADLKERKQFTSGESVAALSLLLAFFFSTPIVTNVPQNSTIPRRPPSHTDQAVFSSNPYHIGYILRCTRRRARARTRYKPTRLCLHCRCWASRDSSCHHPWGGRHVPTPCSDRPESRSRSHAHRPKS